MEEAMLSAEEEVRAASLEEEGSPPDEESVVVLRWTCCERPSGVGGPRGGRAFPGASSRRGAGPGGAGRSSECCPPAGAAVHSSDAVRRMALAVCSPSCPSESTGKGKRACQMEKI